MMLRLPFIFIVLQIICIIHPLSAQSFHYLYGGINFSQLIATSKVPDGTGTSGVIHVSGNYQAKTGFVTGYDYNQSIGKLFYIHSGVNLSLSRSRMDYSTRPYGASCSSCNTFTQADRIGIMAEYRLLNLSIPIAFSIPFTTDRATLFKIGGDLTWMIRDHSIWRFTEINTRYELINDNWFRRVVSTSEQIDRLDSINFHKGISLSIFQRLNFLGQFFGVEGGARLGIDRLDDQPALNQVIYHLKIGYIFQPQKM